MNLLSKLPGLRPKGDPEIDEEFEAKKGRIEFHRAKVRNGPVNYVEPTSGQIRRGRDREVARMTKKSRRRQVRAFQRDQAEGYTLRGHLAAAGVVPYSNVDFRTDPKRALTSILWIASHYGTPPVEGSQVEVTYEFVLEALLTAFNRYRKIIRQPEVKALPPGYVLPVSILPSNA